MPYSRLLLLICGCIGLFGGCASTAKSPPTPGSLCPDIPLSMYNSCGCSPQSRLVYNATRASGLNEAATNSVNSCLRGDGSGEAAGNSIFSGRLKFCLDREVERDPALSAVIGNISDRISRSEINEEESNAWLRCAFGDDAISASPIDMTFGATINYKGTNKCNSERSQAEAQNGCAQRAGPFAVKNEMQLVSYELLTWSHSIEKGQNWTGDRWCKGKVTISCKVTLQPK